jgi:hypothetical protein
MHIFSPVFLNGKSIPSKYTCEGENCSPPLEWRDVPARAVSLALLMDDPDVPLSLRADGMYDHWVVFNIPPKTKMFKEGASPPGVEGKNTGGKNGYYGPCPPDREHRYFFKLYALDKMLDLKAGVSKKEVEMAMHGHVLAEATLLGLYKKVR